jgi:hypothetical protein
MTSSYRKFGHKACAGVFGASGSGSGRNDGPLLTGRATGHEPAKTKASGPIFSTPAKGARPRL